MRVPLVLGGLFLAVTLGAETPSFIRYDPAKIVTAERCGECHAAEYEVWKETPHATGFDTLHRKDSAEAIRDRLGLRLIKRDSRCLGCHYTAVEREGDPRRGRYRAISGVSCESCHGAGRDYLNVHNDYGPGKDHASETAEHRARRIEASRQAGMRRPSDLYGVASSCFGCHMVPDERLINVGGHSIGSGDFELVEWSQGKIRHNFLESFLSGGGAVNAERSPEQRRRMYVAGRAAELEHALRGVASASEEGVYLKAMQRRVRGAVSEMRAIARRADLPEAEAMLAAVRRAEVGLGEEEGLLQAANEIAGAARQFLDAHDGTALASLDPLVLGLEEDLDDEPVVAGVDGGVDGGTVGVDPATPTAPPVTAGAKGSAPGGPETSRATGAVPAVGEVRRKIRPESPFDTLGPGACSKCHAPQNQWWYGDAHFTSADPFFDEAPDNVRIARLYGLRPADALRGDRLCMDCHGSVVSGRERRAVTDGVGCESCHGPAAQYKEPHQEGDKALGAKRPGYLRALELGMNELQDAPTRARVCTGCHYVTDPRLISAGHPSGAGFDYLAGMKRIRHWQDDPAAGALKPAFAAALASRGPVPEVQRAKLGIAAPPSAGVREERRPSPDVLSQRGPRPAGAAATTSATAAGGSTGGFGLEEPVREIDLPPFPEIDASASVEEILLLLRERFELLYREVYNKP